MRKRTMKEQEYQLIALKYRAEALLFRVLAEVGLGGWIMYGLLQWHWIPASLAGAYSILGVWNLTRMWYASHYEYLVFRQEFEEMVAKGYQR